MALLGQVIRGVGEHWAAVERDDRDARELRGYVAGVGAWVPEAPVGRAAVESSSEGPGPLPGAVPGRGAGAGAATLAGSL